MLPQLVLFPICGSPVVFRRCLNKKPHSPESSWGMCSSFEYEKISLKGERPTWSTCWRKLLIEPSNKDSFTPCPSRCAFAMSCLRLNWLWAWINCLCWSAKFSLSVDSRLRFLVMSDRDFSERDQQGMRASNDFDILLYQLWKYKLLFNN